MGGNGRRSLSPFLCNLFPSQPSYMAFRSCHYSATIGWSNKPPHYASIFSISYINTLFSLCLDSSKAIRKQVCSNRTVVLIQLWKKHWHRTDLRQTKQTPYAPFTWVMCAPGVRNVCVTSPLGSKPLPPFFERFQKSYYCFHYTVELAYSCIRFTRMMHCCSCIYRNFIS